MAVQHISENEFDEVVLKSKEPVLVDFYATWCGPCKMMSPILEQLSEEKTDVKFAAIDVDEAERLAIKYGISSVPCMILFNNGEETDRVIGAVPKSKLMEVVSL
jgi:thioredoxin 1